MAKSIKKQPAPQSAHIVYHVIEPSIANQLLNNGELTTVDGNGTHTFKPNTEITSNFGRHNSTALLTTLKQYSEKQKYPIIQEYEQIPEHVFDDEFFIIATHNNTPTHTLIDVSQDNDEFVIECHTKEQTSHYEVLLPFFEMAKEVVRESDRVDRVEVRVPTRQNEVKINHSQNKFYIAMIEMGLKSLGKNIGGMTDQHSFILKA